MSENKNSMIRIGAFWLHRKSDGEIYLSGSLNGAKLLLFKNQFKKGEKHPDFILFVANPEKKDTPSADELDSDFSMPPDDDKDIPF
jgi:uncharacterized protein (DUF736 family)